MSVKSPIGWIGGKSYICRDIIALFPVHKHYVEVFGGALHVFFAKNPIARETVNDLNKGLINFWLVCRDNLDELLHKVEWTPYSRALFEQWKAEPTPEDPVERAARWFYINSCTYSAVYHGGWSYRKEAASGGSCPSHRFRSRIARLQGVRDRLARVQIECADFRDMFSRYGNCDLNLLYCDPPYVGCEMNYEERFTEQDHLDLARVAHESEAKVVMSYGKHPMVEELYGDWTCKTFEVTRRSAMCDAGGTKPRDLELVLCNYSIEADLFNWYS